jgi:hypothetical protein
MKRKMMIHLNKSIVKLIEFIIFVHYSGTDSISYIVSPTIWHTIVKINARMMILFVRSKYLSLTFIMTTKINKNMMLKYRMFKIRVKLSTVSIKLCP